MESSSSASRSRLNGRTEDETNFEIDGIDPASRERMTGIADVDATTERQNSVSGSTEKKEQRMGPVFRPMLSSAPNFRFMNSTVARPGITPIASPVFAVFGHTGDLGANRRRDEDESHARYEKEVE